MLINLFIYHFQQIRQSDVTPDLTGRAQGNPSDDLKQALEKAQEQQNQFLQSQKELKEKLEMIQKEISKQSQQPQNVSYTAKFLRGTEDLILLLVIMSKQRYVKYSKLLCMKWHAGVKPQA